MQHQSVDHVQGCHQAEGGIQQCKVEDEDVRGGSVIFSGDDLPDDQYVTWRSHCEVEHLDPEVEHKPIRGHRTFWMLVPRQRGLEVGGVGVNGSVVHFRTKFDGGGRSWDTEEESSVQSDSYAILSQCLYFIFAIGNLQKSINHIKDLTFSVLWPTFCQRIPGTSSQRPERMQASYLQPVPNIFLPTLFCFQRLDCFDIREGCVEIELMKLTSEAKLKRGKCYLITPPLNLSLLKKNMLYLEKPCCNWLIKLPLRLVFVLIFPVVGL